MSLSPKTKPDIFFSNSVFIFFTRFFPVLAAFLIQMGYSHYLPKGAYGSYQNFWVHLIIFAPIACAGVHVFIVTYAPGFLIRLVLKCKPKYLIYFSAWLIFVCLAFASLQQSTGYSFIVSLAFLFVHAISAIAESFLIVFKKIRQLAFINLVYALAFFYIHYLSLHNAEILESIFTYILLLMTVKLVCYLFLSVNYVLANKKAALETELITAGVGSLWFHMGLYEFLNVLSRWVDKFVVSLLLAESISGIYFNGAVDIPFIPLIVGAAASATLIQLADKKDKAEPAYTVLLANRSGRLLATIVFPLFFFAAVFRYELFEFFFSNKFEAAVPIFLASSFMIPLRAYTFTAVLQSRGKGGLINAGAIIDLVLALLLVYPLYQVFGLAGIALSFTIATYVQAAFYLACSSRMLGVPVLSLIPYKYWLTLLIIFACLFIGIHYLGTICFSHKITLTLGFVLTTAVILIALLSEFKKPVTPYGDAQV